MGSKDAQRITELEGRIEGILGVVEAGIIKMDASKAAAMAAEQRARGTLARAEKLAETLDSDPGGEEEDSFLKAARAYADVVPPGDDETGNGMPPLPDGVESRRAGLQAVRGAKRR